MSGDWLCWIVAGALSVALVLSVGRTAAGEAGQVALAPGTVTAVDPEA